MDRSRPRRPMRLFALIGLVALVASACTTETEEAADETPSGQEAQSEELPEGPYQESPYWPYLSAHIDDENPRELAGGPITVEGSAEEGSINWILPGKRELDPAVFGTADDPKGTEQPAMFVGVPEGMREETDDGGQRTSQPTPFSDESASITGSLEMTLVDATATDAATTDDEIDFTAEFTGPDESEYTIEVDRAAPHGWAFPTGGGVVTNFIQHGVTGWGTRLMPTEYDDVAFYGLGDITRDGETIASDRVVHMMLTEFVRGEDYQLVSDEDVNPNARHLHLMVAPFDPFGNPDPVSTGFELPNGEEQPFFHIMYPEVDVSAEAPSFPGELPQALTEPPPEISMPEPPEEAPYRESPWWPYLSAHTDEEPQDVLFGPFAVQATVEEGPINWILPGKRELDPAIFGTADDPRGTEVPPMALGVPPGAREDADGGQRTNQPVPFADPSESVTGSLDMTVIDASATDGATTKDRIDFEATFTAPGDDGAEYRVVVKNAAPHGWFHPTGGGVVTHFIQHGATGWATRLMPTEYDDVAFWGPGTIFRNGEEIASGRVVHMMLTEFVRGEGYELVLDENVNPSTRHLHLMVAPVDPFGRQDPVPTGFELPNGEEQPFFHIMYPDVDVQAGSVDL